MRSFAFLAVAAVAAAAGSAQGLSPYLPSAQRSRAAGLLSIVDSSTKGVELRRDAAFNALRDAEDASLTAFAASSASQGGAEWSGPGGMPAAGRAREAFATARSRALAAARALAEGTASADGSSVADLVKAREEAAAKLSALMNGAGLDAASQAAASKYLLGRAKGLAELFPEALEAGGALMKGGKGDRALWISALLRKGSEEIAAVLVASRADASKAAARNESALARLDAALSAYRALVAALPLAAHPDILLDPAFDPSPLASAARSLAALPGGRAASLLAAMDRGDGRDRAASASARRLAALVPALPSARVDLLARLSGLGRSELLRFAELVARPAKAAAKAPAAGGAKPASSAAAERQGRSAADEAAALASVWAAIAQREAEEADTRHAGGSAEAGAPPAQPLPRRGVPDPLLPLLRRPELLGLARAEPRYARLYGAAGVRLGALYRLADAETVAILFADAATSKAAAAALGESASSLTVESIDLPAGEALARAVGFRARATGAKGQEVLVPIAAAQAAAAYAKGFARAFGLAEAADAGKAERLLAESGQRVVGACVSSEGRAYVLASVPAAPAFDELAMEAALFAKEEP